LSRAKKIYYKENYAILIVHMSNRKKKIDAKKEPVLPPSPEPPKKPVSKLAFKPPVLNPPFPTGARIRLDQRSRFFSRTRRGGI
jgi:hypothetical protein